MRLSKLFSSSFLIIVLNIGIGFSSTYYVSPTGSDSGSGSLGTPWRSIGLSCKKLSPNDTLIVADGTYTGVNNMISYHNGNCPPNGTGGNYTTIKSSNPFMVVIDGQYMYDPMDFHNSNYLAIDGFVVEHSSPDAVVNACGSCMGIGFQGWRPTPMEYGHVKVTRCGSIDSANFLPADMNVGRSYAFCITGMSYVLLQDCFACGSANYFFLFLDSDYCIGRRLVCRPDRSISNTGSQLTSPFRLYGTNYSEYQNCIAVDGDQTQYIFNGSPSTLGTGYGWWFGSNTSDSYSCSTSTYRGCIEVNMPAFNVGMQGTQMDAHEDGGTYNNSLIDCASIGTAGGFDNQGYTGGTPTYLQTIIMRNCLFKNCSSGYAIDCSKGANWGYKITFASNCVVENCANGFRNVQSDYNVLYNIFGTTYNQFSAGSNDYVSVNGNAFNPIYSPSNSTGGIKYIPREELASNLSGKGDNTGDIGPNILYKVGIDGSLFGDPGWNTVSSNPLWPFPYENIIQSYMSAYSYQNWGKPAINGARGFCSGTSIDGSAQTLTKYIWEYLGNQIPSSVYNPVSVVTASANGTPTNGNAPLSVNFTGSAATTNGTITGYSWTFGDGGTSASQSPSHVYSSAGSYTATLLATDSNGDSGSAIVSVTVTANSTYSISGSVASGGSALGGVSVKLTGGASAVTISDASGNYQFTSLAKSLAYTVTPSSAGYTFAPVSVTTASLTGNWTGQNFAGTVKTANISGTVKTGGGAQLNGATVQLSGGASRSTTSNGGSYSFSNLPEGSNYTVTVQMPGYSFSPVSFSTATFLGALSNWNFTGTVLTAAISGAVTHASDASPFPGVKMTLAGGASKSTVTDGSGNYSFNALSSTANYTVTPSSAGFAFSPVKLSTSPALLSTISNWNFAGTVSIATASISGYARDSVTAVALLDVLVTLTGGAQGSDTTDSGGSYQFSGLSQNSAYTVTPTLSGYTFAPVSISTNSLTSDLINPNFMGTRQTRNITGYVRNGAAGVSNITVNITGGSGGSVSTDSSGYYSFLNLPKNASFSVAPADTGFWFAPVQYSTTSLTNDVEWDFNATPIVLAIGGYVRDASSNGLSGVSVVLSPDNVSLLTGTDGSYQFTSNLYVNYPYTVTPATFGSYTFAPVSYSTASLNGIIGNWNFTGALPAPAAVQYTITGQVLDGKEIGVPGVAVVLSGDVSKNTITDANGNFQLTGLSLNARCVLQLSKAGYEFSPQRSVSVLITQQRTILNFRAAAVMDMTGVGSIKILGSAAGRGTVNPDSGDVAKIYFKGDSVGRFEMRIFTIGGKQVHEDTMEGVSEGIFEWLPKDMASGTYIVYIKGPGISAKQKLMVIR